MPVVVVFVVVVTAVAIFDERRLPRRQEVSMLIRVGVAVNVMAVAMPNRESGHEVTLVRALAAAPCVGSSRWASRKSA